MLSPLLTMSMTVWRDMSSSLICRPFLVKLVQPYDSNIYTQQPEELPAQWGFYWSTDPKKALPFIALATSPYNIDDCCTEGTAVYASTINGNVFAPSDYPAGWRYVGEIGEV